MMRVVLDTNVLVSAVIKPQGHSRQILRQAPARFGLVSCEFILSEVAEVLPRKHIQARYRRLVTPKLQQRYLAAIRSVATVVDIQTLVQVVEADKDDDTVLACAKDGGADYVVTGDPHLLELGEWEDIMIVKPVKFLGILKKL